MIKMQNLTYNRNPFRPRGVNFTFTFSKILVDYESNFFRKGAGVAELARLESVCTSKAYRGFESHPFRSKKTKCENSDFKPFSHFLFLKFLSDTPKYTILYPGLATFWQHF